MEDDAHITAHRHSIRHREEIERSDTCGCFYCLELFPPATIAKWVDEGVTARCPRCGIDSVLGNASGYPLTEEFLRRMKAHWF
jgi:hypothetical protein